MTSLSLFTFMYWRRKWQPTPVFLPGESQGREAWIIKSNETLSFCLINPRSLRSALDKERSWAMRVRKSSFPGPSRLASPRGHCSPLNSASRDENQPLLCFSAAALLQSCPTLCDPIDGSPPDFPSLGFSRQEHWSGLPFPSPIHESEK